MAFAPHRSVQVGSFDISIIQFIPVKTEIRLHQRRHHSGCVVERRPVISSARLIVAMTNAVRIISAQHFYSLLCNPSKVTRTERVDYRAAGERVMFTGRSPSLSKLSGGLTHRRIRALQQNETRPHTGVETLLDLQLTHGNAFVQR